MAKKIWRTSDGRMLTLKEMDTEHLHNLVAYLYRRLEEFRKLQQFAQENDHMLPEPRTQGRTYVDWINSGTKELHKREKKAMNEAVKKWGIEP